MDWLREIFDKILSLFPQCFIIAPYEAGIRITFGKRVKALEAGWYIIWPLIQRLVWMEVQSQVVDLRNQSIRTIDGHELIVSGAVQYKIVDIEKAIINIQDVDKSIETLSLGIIMDFISTKVIEDCKSMESLKKEILKGLRDAASGWGLKIEKVYITDLGRTKNLRLLLNKEGNNGSIL